MGWLFTYLLTIFLRAFFHLVPRIHTRFTDSLHYSFSSCRPSGFKSLATLSLCSSHSATKKSQILSSINSSLSHLTSILMLNLLEKYDLTTSTHITHTHLRQPIHAKKNAQLSVISMERLERKYKKNSNFKGLKVY